MHKISFIINPKVPSSRETAFQSLRFPLRPENREFVPVRIVEVRRPQRSGDAARFVREYHATCGQSLVRRAHVLYRERQLGRSSNRIAPARQWLTEAQRHAAAIQERESFALSLELEAEFVAVKRYRARIVGRTEHHDSDLRQCEICSVHWRPPAYYCTHAGYSLRVSNFAARSRIRHDRDPA